MLRRGGQELELIPPVDPSVRSILETTGVLHALDPDVFDPPVLASDRHLAIVHVETADQQERLVSEFVDLLMRSTPLSQSVLDGFRWIFNEVTGNIFDHSNSVCGGFVQLDIHKSSNRLALCVCDPGDGMLKSLKSAGLHRQIIDDLEAIEHAIRRGFTSNPERNQGNGLAGSLDLAKAFKGRYAVQSGSGLLVWEHERPLTQRRIKSSMFGTLVDVQLDMSVAVDNLGEVITGQPESDYEPHHVITDDYLNLEDNVLEVHMAEEAFGFGNRQAGVQMYQKCMNLLNNSSLRIVVDWTNVPLIASSFADEFIGKLYADLGPIDFSSKVELRGMDRTTKHILNSVIAQRMSQRYRV